MTGLQITPSSNQWFILRGDLKYGPYDYRSVLSMLQKGELFEYNYVWASHLENWTMLGDIQDFSKDRMCLLIKEQSELADAFIERTGPRVQMEIPVYAHNNHSMFDGHTISLSENGALVLLNDPLLLPGQKVLLSFRSTEGNPQPFNVLCEIIRKNYSRQRLNVKSGLHYAVRFLQVQNSGKNQLTKWIRGGVSKEETNGIFKVHE